MSHENNSSANKGAPNSDVDPNQANKADRSKSSTQSNASTENSQERVFSDLIHTVKDYMDEKFSYAHSIKNDAGMIDLKKLQERERFIFEFGEMKIHLEKLVHDVQEKIKTLNSIHESEISQVDSVLSRIKGVTPVSTPVIKTPVVENNIADDNETLSSLQASSIETVSNNTGVSNVWANHSLQKSFAAVASGESDTTRGWNLVKRNKATANAEQKPPSENYTKIFVTQVYYLFAIKVPSWEALAENMEDGHLYYVEDSDHFAFSIGGMFYHGNIGTIYTDQKEPAKIKNCRYGSACSKDSCDYYHNPITTKHCKDRRSYVASSFLYSPTVAGNMAFKNKRRARRFGSIDNIDLDLPNLSEEEGQRFIDQTMHDMLCSMLLKKYREFGDKAPC